MTLQFWSRLVITIAPLPIASALSRRPGQPGALVAALAAMGAMPAHTHRDDA